MSRFLLVLASVAVVLALEVAALRQVETIKPVRVVAPALPAGWSR
jgi:hypothetical protein